MYKIFVTLLLIPTVIFAGQTAIKWSNAEPELQPEIKEVIKEETENGTISESISQPISQSGGNNNEAGRVHYTAPAYKGDPPRDSDLDLDRRTEEPVAESPAPESGQPEPPAPEPEPSEEPEPVDESRNQDVNICAGRDGEWHYCRRTD